MTEASRTELEADVAVRLEGYRWVRWVDGRVPELPRDVVGRFLAPPCHVLAHLWVPAPPDTPLAPQPFRHVPGYASDVALALRACERRGLFRDGSAALTRSANGAWRVTADGLGRALEHDSLPLLLCTAGLAWSRVSGHAARGT